MDAQVSSASPSLPPLRGPVPAKSSQEAAALAAAAFLLSAAALIYLSLAVPDYIRSDWATSFAITGVPCIATGLVLLRLRRLPRAGLVAVVLFGDVAIVLSAYASIDRNGTTAGALLSLPTLFTASFERPRWLAGQAVAAAGCAWVINSLVPADFGVHVIRTAVLTVACVVPGMIVVLLRRQLDRAIVTDPLTGLANRRGLDARFPALIARSRRSGMPLAVLLADIDHFKQINDVRGHLAGDEVLRGVARATVAAVRAQDLVVRFLGEEIAVVLVAADEEIREIAERIRRRVEEAATAQRVTVSVGAAWAMPGEGDATLLDALTQEADARMYEAKRAGRNQAVLPMSATR